MVRVSWPSSRAWYGSRSPHQCHTPSGTPAALDPDDKKMDYQNITVIKVLFSAAFSLTRIIQSEGGLSSEVAAVGVLVRVRVTGLLAFPPR